MKADFVIQPVKKIARRVRRALFREPDPITSAAAAHWDQQIQERSVYWTEPPVVAEYVNRLITTVAFLSPTQGLKVGWAYRPFKCGLSIGCGTGELERDLHRQRICERIDAVDISKASLRSARALAKEEHMRGIRYRRADFNTMTLPPSGYNIVFFHGSLHHATDPDRLLQEVEKTLRPRGFLYVDEYVGPSRHEWTADDLKYAQEEYDKLPDVLKSHPLAAPVAPDDPSEMINSSRILPAVTERFDVVHYRPYWGNLLFPLFCALRGDELLKPEYAELIARWVEREQTLVEQGAFRRPLYAVVLARKKDPAKVEEAVRVRSGISYQELGEAASSTSKD